MAEKVIAIIPAYNESGKIGIVVEKVKRENIVDEIVIIDDGSKDNTAIEAKNAGATVFSHSKNIGAGAAIRTGIDYALSKKYDIIVVLGGDDQDEPYQIKRLLRPITEDEFVFVQGSRYMAGGERVNIPLFRWITTGLYSFIFKILTRFPVSDGTNGFRAFRTKIFEDKDINIWQEWLNKYELEPYLYYKLIEKNYKITEVPVTKKYPLNKIGFTKMIPFLDWWSIFRPLLYLKLGIKK